MLGRDGIAGLVVLATSLFLFWLTLGLERNPLVPVGPGFYPRIVLGLTALLSLCLVLFDFFGEKKPSEGTKANYLAVATQFILFAVYAGALPLLGFRIATFAYVTAANLLLDPPRRPLAWLRAPLLAALTAAATWYVFEGYLAVLLPRGRWTDF
ncbi:MAG TPA: tripartite tricarboxylate transporter TctB family protein [Burkholderiales bacterium]|nr:tripartite tricarboxylate transporter TctB family protein [Burkholderiales bacterium]